MIDGEMYKYKWRVFIKTAKGELREMVQVSSGCGRTPNIYCSHRRLTLCMAWHEHRLMLAR